MFGPLLTFDGDLALPVARVGVELDLGRDLPDGLFHAGP